MSAVVRVKRRIDEDPLGALVLNCKRRRIDENEEIRENLLETRDEVSTILKFAGTVETQEESIGKQITRLTKDEAKQLAQKSRKPNLAARSRQEMRQNIQENRFRVVNCYRTINNNDDEVAQEITVVDIEKQDSNNVDNGESTANQTGGQGESSNDLSSEYVYDLYLPENEQQANELNYVDTYLSVRPFDDLVYEDHYGPDDSDESEDSNQENYYRNDYPDTEEESSISEHDMRRAIAGLDINGERELSTDDEYGYDDSYVHSLNPDDRDNDIDCADLDRCGRYAARGQRKKDEDFDDYDSELDESHTSGSD